MVIMYADKITDSMQRTIDDTNYRREKQMNYNKAHNIEPKPLQKKIENSLAKSVISEVHYDPTFANRQAAEEEAKYYTDEQIQKEIQRYKKLMTEAATSLDFEKAASYRNELRKWEALLGRS